MLGALATVGGQLLGNVTNAVLSHNENIRQRKFAEGQAQINRDFQRDMSNTAMQRGVADAKKAGLHPWLVAGGSGASTPSGAQASPAVSTPQIEMPDFLSYGVSLKQLEQADRQLSIMDKKATADIVKTLSDADLNQFRKILMQRGSAKASLEGEASEILRKGLKWLKENVQMNKQPGADNPHPLRLR